MIEKLKYYFQDPVPEGWHPAAEPYVVEITLTNGEVLRKHFDEDHYFGVIVHDPYWKYAKQYAGSRADSIRQHGLVVRDERGYETHFPVHRIHQIEVYKKGGENV